MTKATKIDLSELDLKALEALQSDVAKAIMSFKARRRAEALAAAEAAAREKGFSLTELTGRSAKGTRTMNPPKYRHPENPEVTWSGRGRRPKWFSEALDGGVAPEEMEMA